MQTTKPNGVSRTRSLALRIDRAEENRLALGLTLLLSLATFTVLAATSALSRHHIDDIARLLAP